MTNITAATFARLSYWLAGAASVLIAIAMLINFIPNETIAAVGIQVCWLSLPISAVGAFMGHTARSALKKVINEDDPPKVWKQARNGALLNTLMIVAGTLAALVAIVSSLLTLLNS